MGIRERKAREKHELTQLILDTARDIFIKYGFEGASIRNTGLTTSARCRLTTTIKGGFSDNPKSGLKRKYKSGNCHKSRQHFISKQTLPYNYIRFPLKCKIVGGCSCLLLWLSIVLFMFQFKRMYSVIRISALIIFIRYVRLYTDFG